METFNYAVFVVTTLSSTSGPCLSTTVIQARDKLHAETMAEQINDSNVYDSCLQKKATVIGS